jgi:hypothetical protein
MKLCLTLLIILAMPLNSKAASDKVFEINYNDSPVVYMHSGTVADIKLMGIPASADIIQVVANQDPNLPKSYVIGQRSIAVNQGSSSGYADFKVKLDEIVSGASIKKSAQINLRSFKKVGETYELLDKFSVFIRPIVCPKINKPVCGVLKVKKCLKGQRECNDFVEKKVTYENECLLTKAGAELLKQGSCD